MLNLEFHTNLENSVNAILIAGLTRLKLLHGKEIYIMEGYLIRYCRSQGQLCPILRCIGIRDGHSWLFHRRCCLHQWRKRGTQHVVMWSGRHQQNSVCAILNWMQLLICISVVSAASV